jgi:DNA-binding NtrC family response regulator
MQTQLEILIVSCRPENRKSLLRVLEDLPVTAFCASNLAQARETLASHSVGLVFCEERVSDGSYRDLLEETRADKAQGTRFVTMLCTGEWEEYLEALHLGADEVIRCPLEATDIDMALIHAMREHRALENSGHADAGGAFAAHA